MSLQLNNISTILFDLGGVLVELQGTPFKPKWLSQESLEADIWPVWWQSDVARAFESGHLDGQQFARRFIDEAVLDVDTDEFIAHFMKWPSRLYDGVPQMLHTLSGNYRLAALSNSNALHWPMIMQDMQLASLIPDCVSSHQIGVMKPERQSFDRLLDMIGVPAGEILFLDDNQPNVDMARSLGMQAVKVASTGGVETVRALGLLDTH